MDVVVDANIALKWVKREGDTDLARQVRDQNRILAPDLIWPECANALWTAVRRSALTHDEAELALTALLAYPLRLVASSGLVARAFQLATQLQHSVYDCTYLAAAEANNAILISADLRFINKVAADPALSALARPLS